MMIIKENSNSGMFLVSEDSKVNMECLSDLEKGRFKVHKDFFDYNFEDLATTSSFIIYKEVILKVTKTNNYKKIIIIFILKKMPGQKVYLYVLLCLIFAKSSIAFCPCPFITLIFIKADYSSIDYFIV